MPEIEAKFLIQRTEQFDEVLRTLKGLGYTISEGSTETLTDRYYDTEDWSLLRAGWAYRCRDGKGQQKLTLKALASGPGPVFEREEIEQVMPDARTDTGELPSGPVQRRLVEIANGERRRELFHVQNLRTIYGVGGPATHPGRFELGLDRTRIGSEAAAGSGNGGLELTELELELKEGDAETVEQLAKLLQERVGLVPAQLSKFERGLQVVGVPVPGLQKPLARRLRPADPLLALMYQYLGDQLAELKKQEPHAWEGLMPEGVHQMRIAIRRIRSLLRAFRNMFPGGKVVHLNAELRWLAKKLGDVRDADVYDEAFRHYRTALPETDARALSPYEKHLDQVGHEAREALLEALSSERYSRLTADLEEFVDTGPPVPVLRRFGRVSIAAGAETQIRPALKKILKHGRRIDKRSPATQLHRLRIKGKQLRYLLEFFSEVQRKGWKKHLGAVRGLQDVLGEHQDACIAQNRLKGFARSMPREAESEACRLAMRCLLRFEQQRLSASRGRFAKAWGRFEKVCDY